MYTLASVVLADVLLCPALRCARATLLSTSATRRVNRRGLWRVRCRSAYCQNSWDGNETSSYLAQCSQHLDKPDLAATSVQPYWVLYEVRCSSTSGVHEMADAAWRAGRGCVGVQAIPIGSSNKQVASTEYCKSKCNRLLAFGCHFCSRHYGLWVEGTHSSLQYSNSSLIKFATAVLLNYVSAPNGMAAARGLVGMRLEYRSTQRRTGRRATPTGARLVRHVARGLWAPSHRAPCTDHDPRRGISLM